MPTKQHRDFVILVKNGVEINALVAMTQDVTTPATQEVPAFTTEHLTLVYLDPASARPRQTGDQLRASIQTVFDVPPLTQGRTTGWKDVVSVEVAEPEPVKEPEPEATLPPAPTAESMAEQDAHDHATGNVNGDGKTPNEALASEGQDAEFVAPDPEVVEAAKQVDVHAEVPPVGLGGPVTE